MSNVKPDLTVIDTPLLSDLHLSLESAFSFTVKEFPHLAQLHLESTNLRSLLSKLTFGTTVRSLTDDSTNWEIPVGVTKSNLELLVSALPNASSITMTSGVWSEFETYPGLGSVEAKSHMKRLKCITAYLTVNDLEVTLSSPSFRWTTVVAYLIWCYSTIGMFPMSQAAVCQGCMAHCARVRWKWGI